MTSAKSPWLFTAAAMEFTRCENATGLNASIEVATSANPAIAATRRRKCERIRNQMNAKGVAGTRAIGTASSSGSDAYIIASVGISRGTTLDPDQKGARRIVAFVRI